MKKIFLSLTALFFILAFSACKKDKDDDSNFFRFKVDGKEFEATGLLAYATNFSTQFTMYGVNTANGNETCYINLPLGTGKGTYTLGSGDSSGYYISASNEAFSTNWGASSGSITIEEIDASHAKGTFQFTAYDSGTELVKKTLTEGNFDVAFR